MSTLIDASQAAFSEIASRIHQEALHEFRIEFRPGKSLRQSGLLKVVIYYPEELSERDVILHGAYLYGEALFKTLKVTNNWPRFVMAAAHFAFVQAVLYRFWGRDEAVIYTTDCLAEDKHWSDLHSVGRGYPWYWLLAAVSLTESMNLYYLSDIFDKENWREIETTTNNLPARDWAERKRLIENCVDRVAAVTNT